MQPRAESARPRSRRSGRTRTAFLITAGVVFLLFTTASEIATFFTDKLWFDSVELGEVWSGVIGAKLQLAGLFGVVLTATLWFNLYLADRRGPLIASFGPGDDVFGRYQDVLDRRAGTVRLVAAVGFGLIGGMNMSSRWEEWLLFRNGGDFGRVDATFSEDIGFYVFRLPFLNAVVNQAFAWGCIALVITAVAYYLNGAIRPQVPVERVSMAAKRHLSMILAFIVVMRSVGYWLARYDLVYSDRSVVHGATYTEVTAQLPALELLTITSLITAGIIVFSVFRRGFTLPMVSLAAWFGVSLVAGVAYPFFVYTTQVTPSTSDRERPYITQNIAATRDGLGLTDDKVKVERYAYDRDKRAAAAAVEDNPGTIRNVAILDPERVQKTFQNQQGNQNFYEYVNLDVDRYPVKGEDGRLTEAAVVLGTRNLSYANAPKGWENQTLAYTHGYGGALATATGVGQGGAPDYLVKGIPTTVDSRLELGDPGTPVDGNGDAAAATPSVEPAIYYGELTDDTSRYVLVGATRDEIDYVDGDQNTTNSRYEGGGGVAIDGFASRLAFSIRFRDTQLMLSDFVTTDTRLLMRRDVDDRLTAVAPFITWDDNPYPILSGGRIVYVVDGYTTTDRLPNAQRVGWEATDSARDRFNYVRNSVKATVDAYDGTIRIYTWDRTDPILAAWQAAFPSLFQSFDTMPADVLAHVRYPEDLFRVQSREWGRYRLSDPGEFFSQAGAWSVAQKPSDKPQDSTQRTTPTPAPAGNIQSQTAPAASTGTPIDPAYALLKLPGDTKETFNLLRQFVQVGTNSGGAQQGLQNMSGFMLARSDPDNYGKLVVYETPVVPGPVLIDNMISANQEVSSLVTLLAGRGSQVDWGAMLLVPVGNGSLVWVRPMYVTPSGQTNPSAVPVVSNVIVVFGEQVVMKPTLREALTTLFKDVDPNLVVQTFESGGGVGSDPLATGGNGTTTTSTTATTGSTPGGSSVGTSPTSTLPEGGGDVPSLIRDASVLLEDAERAYDERDLNRYLDLVDQARRKLAEATRLMAGEDGTTTTTADPSSSTTSSSSTTPTTGSPPTSATDATPSTAAPP